MNELTRNVLKDATRAVYEVQREIALMREIRGKLTWWIEHFVEQKRQWEHRLEVADQAKVSLTSIIERLNAIDEDDDWRPGE